MNQLSRINRGIARRLRPRLDRIRQRVEATRESHGRPDAYSIEVRGGPETAVEEYWSGYTVASSPFLSAAGSLRHLALRDKIYPLFHELLELWGDHQDRVVLDYGCGPANDVVGFLVHGKASQVIGVDVSATSLYLDRRRLALHNIDPVRVRLIKVSDAVPTIPLPDDSVDHIYCEGVLHHTSYPNELLAEFRRVLRPNGRALVMVYNHDSLFLHLYVAYVRQILDQSRGDLPTDEAFSFNTDGEGVPISRPYPPEMFASMCQVAGFEVAFRGGYFYGFEELSEWRHRSPFALHDARLGADHRSFLAGLVVDERGFPTWHGRYAGIGGTFELR